VGRTGWILFGLVAGVCLGLGLRAWSGPALISFVKALHPVGQLWLNGLRMTLVPLVFCVMASGVGAVARAASAGRVLGLTILLFVILLLSASVMGAGLALGAMKLWPVSPIGQSLMKAATGTPPVPDFVGQIIAFIPINPIAAAAQTEVTPLIVFASIFGAAATRVANADAIFALLTGVTDTMLVIVNWVLWAAPLGVFLLSLDAVINVGGNLAAALAQYVILLSAVLVVAIVVAMVAGAFGGGGGIMRFAKAVFPSQALAASTQSSISALPLLLTAAEEGLSLPPPLVASVMPLACTVFRFGNVTGGVAAGLIGAYLCGVHPSITEIALAAVIGVIANVGVIGLPGQAVLFIAYGPIFAALGAPFEILTLLIAVFTLPDILDTTANVTGDLAVTAIVARLTKRATAEANA
jgi:proton glutamate symport protein